MTPLAIAMMLAAAGKGAQGVASGASQIDWLSPEERNRQKELERLLALGELGSDEATRQRILNQQMGPQQALEREAFSRQAQQAQIADVGQGAFFRGQQALLEGAAAGRAEATQRGQEIIAEQDLFDEAAQMAELKRLKAQKAANIEGAGKIAGAGLEAAAGIAGATELTKIAAAREDALLAAFKASSEKPASTDIADDFSSIVGGYSDPPPTQTAVPQLTPAWTASEAPAPPEMFNAMQMLGMLPQAPSSGDQLASLYKVTKAVDWGTMTPIFDELGNIVRFSYVGKDGASGEMEATPKALAEYKEGI